MLALRKTSAAPGVELSEIAAPPAPGSGEVAVAVAAVGICGSDVHAYEWTAGYEFMRDAMPVTLGHEFAGTIAAVGDGVADLRPGDRVTCWPTVGCTQCPACRDSRPQDCPQRRIVGLHRDGAMAEVVVVPARNCLRLPDTLSFPAAALTEPLAIAVHAADVAEVTPQARVVVLGPGPIGLFAAWVVHQRGGNVLLAGFDDGVRLAAATAIGIPHVVDLSATPLRDAVRAAFGTDDVDRVIEATGVARSIADGLAVLRSSGVMVAVGIHADALSLDLTRFVRMKHQLRAAHDTTARAFAEALALLGAHADTLATLITAQLPLAQATEAFALARSRRAVKVMLSPEQEAPG